MIVHAGRFLAEGSGDFAVDGDQDVQLFAGRIGENVNRAFEDEVGQVDDVRAQIVRAVAFGVFQSGVVEQHP